MTATLLLVDDDVALAGVLSEALELQLRDRELVVHTVPGRQSALERCEQLDDLDALIVDYHIGPVTGIALYEEVRARFPDVRPLLYTGKATAAVEAEARAAGIPVLWKPQRLHALVEAVRSLLGGA